MTAGAAGTALKRCHGAIISMHMTPPQATVAQALIDDELPSLFLGHLAKFGALVQGVIVQMTARAFLIIF